MNSSTYRWRRSWWTGALCTVLAVPTTCALADSGLIEVADDSANESSMSDEGTARFVAPLAPVSNEPPYAALANYQVHEYCAEGRCPVGRCPVGGCPVRGCDCGDACTSGCCGECCSCSPWWAHKSSVYGEFLYLHATDADVHHAQQQDGVGGAGTVPFGVIGHVDPHHEPGFRAGFNLACTDCTSVGGSYSFFESHAVSAVVPPVIPGGGGAVGSFVHHPGASITASSGPVRATYDVDFQLADFEYRAVWKAGRRYVVNWSLGGRYGHLEQDFSQQGIFGGGNGGAITTVSNVDFDGGGARFGLDGERRIGRGGFSLFARGVVAPMSGSIQADYTLINETTDVLLARSVFKDDRIIASVDYECGLAWMSRQRKWRASAGYLASYWFNVATTNEYIDAVQTNGYDDASGTVTFEGLTARIERRW